jgi:photosynthetic reaction center cytochrome c subunit
MMHARRVGCRAATFLIAIGSALSVGAQQWTPPPRTNLQVLDKGISTRDLVTTMKGFTQGLGVRCEHCHVYKGNDPNDLNAFDFSSDEKAAKRTTRTMLRMLAAINDDYLKDVGEPSAAGKTKVTCYSCHRGEEHPLTERPAPQ